MMVYAVVAFGVIIVWQLWSVGQHLAVQNRQVELLREVCEQLDEQFQWHKPETFARDLRQWLEAIPNDILEELQWHRDHTFAHELCEWLQQMSKDITGGVRNSAKDVTDEVEKSARDVLSALAAIEDNMPDD